jgi:hypothetical protein
MFEYAECKNPGPQYPDVFVIAQKAQCKQVEYFLTSLQNVIREHSKIERARFRSPRQYRHRPRDWTDSFQIGRTETIAHNSGGSPYVQTLQEYNAELRQRISGKWGNNHLEDRQDSPGDRAAESTTSGPSAPGVAQGLKFRLESFAHDEVWSAMAQDALWRDLPTDQDDQGWLKTRNVDDLLQFLCVDAATTTDPKRRTHLIDAIFLRIHRPTAEEYAPDGTQLPYPRGLIAEALAPMVERVSLAFVYVNILASMIAGNHAHPLLRETHQIARHPCNNPAKAFSPRIPRPAYMNTRSFCNMRAKVYEEHGAFVQDYLLSPMLAPHIGGQRPRFAYGLSSKDGSPPQEGDIFEDSVRLRDDVKSMWKVLISCDMFFRECGMQLDWEYMVKCALFTLFPENIGAPQLLGLRGPACYPYRYTSRGRAILEVPYPSKP